MQATGKLKLVNDIQQVSATFQKREFVITTEEQYPQDLCFELRGDKVDIIDAYNTGQEITCSLNLLGREWVNPQGESKFFNTIVCWKIQPKNQ